jgi:cell wall-associated NlpC family hydrolase
VIAYADLIGTPFKLGGRGPDAYDCYGLLEEAYRRAGKTILDYRSPEAGPAISALIAGECARLWMPCEQRAGATVLIRVPFSLHVGYMINDFKMIHTWRNSGGVLVEPVEDWKRRVIGFYEPTAS